MKYQLFLDDDPAGGGGPPAGGEAPPAGGEGAAAAAPSFDRGKLHPALREMAPEEITELFETMAGTLRTVQSRPADSSGIPAHARPAPVREVPKPPTRDEYKNLLDPTSETFDPESAFRKFTEANYGQLVGDLASRSVRGLYGTFRTEFPDFKDYESDVSEALKGRDPTGISEQDVLHTYLAAKGLRQTMKERRDRAAQSATTLAPSASPSGTPKVAELSDLEQEIAHKMFRRIREPEKRLEEYRKFAARDEEGGMSVSVPIGGGKKE